MSFPASTLPALTELLINGAWTAATVREESGVSISRGRANESNRVAPSLFNATLDNRSGDYSNRLPTSANYGKLGRNTQIRHRIRWVRDTFSRTVSSAWGSTDTGQAWVCSGGSASDYSVGTGVGVHTLPTPAVTHASHFAMPVEAPDLTATVSASAVATGDHFYEEVMVGLDGNNCYSAQLQLRTGGTAWLTLYKVVGGAATTIAAAVQVGTYSAGTQWTVRLQQRATGYIRAAAWLAADNPVTTTWTLTSPTPETELTDFSTGFLRSTSGPANTNVNPFFAWDNFEVNDFRFWGEVPSWPQMWDTTGADVTAPIEAAGIMRRLGGRGSKPLKSALTRAMLGISEGDFQPIAHWGMEDGSDATSFASSFSGQPAATITGSVSPAAYSGFSGSDPIPILNQGTISGVFPSYTDTGAWQFQFGGMLPSSGFTNDADMLIIDLAPGGTVATIIVWWQLITQAVQVSALNSAGTTLATNGLFTGDMATDAPYFFALSDITFAGVHTIVMSVFAANGTSFAVTILPGGSPGVPIRYRAIATSVSSGWAFGQAALYTDPEFITTSNIGPNAQAAGGYTGESATDRMTRLCREEGIYLDIVGDTADAQTMGPQRSSKLLDLLFECADADLGILYEPRDALGLAYRTRPSLYNQTGLALDYAGSQVFPPFSPTEDDQLIVNDATARRLNGSWARVTADPGPLSTDPPPDGVGTYDEDRTYNVSTDVQLAPIAGWRVHLGTWDEARYPQVHVMLHAPAFSSSAALTGQAAAVDVGDYLSVDNPPANLPPDLIELLAQGYRETHHTYEWDITWNCTPAGPYRVFVLDQDFLEGDHALASSVTTSATSWSVKTLSGPLLATSGGFGQQWMCEGELVTVTNVTGGASPQTVTVTRNVNGIPGGKAHGADAAVTLHPAPYLAL